MDDEMIERCAKALWDNEQAQPYVKYGVMNKLMFGREGPMPWEDLFNSMQVLPSIAQGWRDKAILIIKAMREPTDEMMLAIEKAEPQLECFLDKEKSPSYIVWQAAIDCIINDK